MDTIDRNLWIILVVLILLEIALIFAYRTLSNKGYFIFSSGSISNSEYSPLSGGINRPKLNTSSTKSLWKPKRW